MKDFDFEEYRYQMDALKEVGNIAAAHAATALSKLLTKEIMIDVSESHLYAVQDFPQGIKIDSEKVAAIYIDIQQKDRGIILFIFPYDKALKLSRMFLDNAKQNSPRSDEELDDFDKAAICEIGNICACAYLNAISKFLDTRFLPSPPSLAVDIPEAILDFPATIIGEKSEYAIVIETKFILDNEQFPGLVLFLIEPPSRELILKRFGIDTN